uniref:M23ase beta-sheet core domain-containing protein n=1 Tax=viral metagenome TaxID=1070528 RepID=A0A2V0RA72_9ZZZZ
MKHMLSYILITTSIVTCSIIVSDAHSDELIGPPDYHTPIERYCIRNNSVNHSFGKVRSGGTKNHQGHDIVASYNTPTYSISNGKIVRITRKGAHGLSIVIAIENFFVRYSHLSSIVVRLNQKVKHGQVVGFTGQSGNAANTEPHLHFEYMTEIKPGYGLKGRKSPLELFPHLKDYMFDC